MPLKFPYRSGARFENRVRKDLVEVGWVVFRSAGSRSPADLVVLGPGKVALVQCRADGRMNKVDRADFGSLAKDLGVRAFLVYREAKAVVYQELGPEGELIAHPKPLLY